MAPAGRLRRATPRRLAAELASRAGRLRGWLARRRLHAGEPHRAAFVVGCQRSGTNMLMWSLERSPEIWVHHEHRRSAAFRDYRLRPAPVIERLVRRSPAPLTVFKPVCDSHLADRLLDAHPGARAVWIFRHWADVANSMVAAFGDHVRDIARWIAEGDLVRAGWRGERLAPEAVERVRALYRPDLPLADAAALFWWLRNGFFFELGLERDPRVLCVRYEDLVGADDAAFRRVFGFLGCRFEPAFRGEVFASSVGRAPAPELAAGLARDCDALLERLAAAARASADPSRGRAAGGQAPVP